MERSFIVTKESEYHDDWQIYLDRLSKQREFVNKFFNEYNIESKEYIIGGSGMVNTPFEEYEAKEITLSINPTENDLSKFNKILTKPHGNLELCDFKKNSNLSKVFARRCIDEKVIINLWRPRLSDYFKSLGLYGCSFQQFLHNNNLFIKVESDYLKADDIPKGFIEIKISEFYKAKEEYENKEGE